MRRVAILMVAGVIASGVALWWQGTGSVSTIAAPRGAARLETRGDKESAFVSDGLAASPLADRPPAFYDPLVIAPCNLAPIAEQDVSSQVDGVLEVIQAELG